MSGKLTHGARAWGYLLSLSSQEGVLKASKIDQYGLGERALRTALERGIMRKTGPGLYLSEDVKIEPEYLPLANLAHRAPKAFICGPSAAAVWKLLPGAYFYPTWCAVPSRARAPPLPDSRCVYLPESQCEPGVQWTSFGRGLAFRVSCPERSICELFRFRRTVGERPPRSALRRWTPTASSRMIENLLELAEALGVRRVVAEAIEQPMDADVLLTTRDLHRYRRRSRARRRRKR